MKGTIKLILGLVIVVSFLLSACAPPPPPVSKIQLNAAEEEAIDEEKKAATLMDEVANLKSELSAEEAKLESLKNYQNEIQLAE